MKGEEEMKKMYQYRFYGNSPNNNPQNLTSYDLQNGEIFRAKGCITHLGIQASPGTVFFLNRALDNPIAIGKTGIYELDVSGYGYISSIIFSDVTLSKVNEENGIIIDILYEGGSV
jgi:hypothetical protein